MRKLTIVVIVLGLIYGGYWFVGSSAIEKGAIGLIEDAQNDGLDIKYASLNTRGFPSRFDTTVTDLVVKSADGEIEWQAPFFQVFALAYAPNEVIAVWPNTQTYILAGDTVTVTSEQMRASAAVEAGTDFTFDRATVEIDQIELNAFGFTMRQDRTLFAIRQSSALENSYDVYLEMLAIDPGADIMRMVDPEALMPTSIDVIRIDTLLGLDGLIDRHATGGMPQPTALTLNDVAIEWGNIALAAEGDFDVSAQGELDGILNVSMTHWRKMIELGKSSGALNDQSAQLLNASLSGMAGDTEIGTPLTFPITISEGEMRFGFVPLGRAPRLRF